MKQNKVIFIGANTKATSNQIASALKVGETLASENYYTIHGGGEGTMLAVTKGIQLVKNPAYDCHVITPTHMIPDNTNVYDKVGKKHIVPDIHTRIGELIELSTQCKYIIVYSGGIGTIHELMSFLVYWYTNPQNMPDILICDEDANEWCNMLSALLSPLCISERPYMLVIKEKIYKLETEELLKVLHGTEDLKDKNKFLR